MTVNYMTCRHCIASNESNPALNARVDERNLAFYEGHNEAHSDSLYLRLMTHLPNHDAMIYE